jgi:hypothetical protein
MKSPSQFTLLEKLQPFFYFFACAIACIFFVNLFTAIYYEFELQRVMAMGRKDLIARIGILAYLCSDLFFPISFVPISFLTLLSMKQQNLNHWTIILGALTGVFLVTVIFFSNKILILRFTRDTILFNLIWLLVLLIFLYWNKNILQFLKHAILREYFTRKA